MLRLLLVDDEPYVVEGLYHLFENDRSMELDVYRANSAPEALKWMKRVRMDIVVTDIRMPGMTGLELQQRIVESWPRCKVIFLTGYDDFDLVRTASRYGGVDYVLKTEGDEDIVNAVVKAADLLREEMDNDQALLKAKEQIHAATPLLQREYLFALLTGTESSPLSRARQFADLHIAMDAEKPCLPVIGRIDGWKESLTYSDQMLLMYSVQNIAEECLEQVVFQATGIDAHFFVWFIQPDCGQWSSGDATADKEDDLWERTGRYVSGMAERVQQACQNVLSLSISIVVADGPVAWSELAYAYSRLRHALAHGFGQWGEMLLSERAIGSGDWPQSSEQPQSRERFGLLGYANRIKHALDNGDRAEFASSMSVLRHALEGGGVHYGLVMELYVSVLTAILSNVNSLPPAEGRSVSPSGLHSLLRLESYEALVEAFASLTELAEQFFQHKNSDAVERTTRLIDRINRHIESNLDGDLSLAALSEIVYLNPSYLSRLYKQLTGSGLTEFIAEARLRRSKELLAELQYKIHEVGKAVGFNSTPYFTTFFKKMTGHTPQQYRDWATSK